MAHDFQFFQNIAFFDSRKIMKWKHTALSLSFCCCVLASPKQLSLRQLLHRQEAAPIIESDAGGANDKPTLSTSTIPASTETKEPTLENPVDANHFFDVSTKCTPQHQKFYKTAYGNAVAIADAARKWPMYGRAESDLYFGKAAIDNAKMSKEVPGLSCLTIKVC